MGALAVGASGAGIWANRLPHFFDDAGFFLRYAESLARGGGFRWNPGEDPIWGASAPLWTLLLGGLSALGLTPEHAALAAGWTLTLASAVLLTLAALRCAGVSGAAWCVLFAATNWRFCGGAVQGMESPIAFLLVGAAMFILSGRAAWPLVGALAALSMVHKLDFAPFGPLLLAALWIRDRRFPWRAALLAAAIAGAWYAFAWLYFGSPLPNSFVAKLTATYARQPREWYLETALLEGGRPLLLVGSALAIPALWRHKHLLVPPAGLILVFVLGYTLRPPPEGFPWYQAAVQPCLVFLAGCGLGTAMKSLFDAGRVTRAGRLAMQGLALLAWGAMVLRLERPLARGCIDYVAHVERDRAEAGRWIDANLPSDAVLLTGFGNIAYHAHRHTIDLSFLNRRPPRMTAGDLIARYLPEVLAYCPWETGVAPEAYRPEPGYRVARVFESARRSGTDFYVVVMVREDVMSSLDPAP